MKHTMKKIIALTLVLCSLAGLVIPAIPNARAEYQFPDAGTTEELGIVLKGTLNMSGQVEIAEKGGRQYLGVPIKGGKFCVFALTDFLEGKPNEAGNYLYDMVDSGIGIPRGIALDSKGVFYATGDSRNVFWYDMKTGDSGQIPTGTDGLTTVDVDDNDNIYAVGGGGNVYRIDGKTKKSEKIYTATDFTTMQGVVCGGGKVFVQGPRKDSLGGGAEVRMLSAKGELLASYQLPASGGTYYLSYVDGVVFVGYHQGTSDGFVALDTAGNKLTRLDMGKNGAIKGIVTDPVNGKSYMCVEEDGTYEYDVATRKLSRKVSKVCNRSLRARNYVKNGKDLLLLSVGPSSVTTIPGPSSKTVNLGGLLEGAGSTYSGRSMVTGVAGTGVAVYVGAYLSPTVGSYSPNAKDPINPSVFSNGHAQTDNMIQYKGKIYAGVYSGGYLVEYDPKTGETRELISGLLDYDQLRIHGLAAGDDKIFFSSIPKDQVLGGCIGWYDLKTGKVYCERNVIKNQAAISLAYDEKNDILYGGTTIRGGTNTTPTAEQAVLFAYNVNTKKLLGSATVGNLTGDKPRYISGIAQDPDTGKLWGMVSHTLFSFSYEGGKLKVTKEWAAKTTPGNPYPDGASKSWFGRPIVFDGVGGMYIGLNETRYGIMKFVIGDDGKVEKATSISSNTTRIYAMGADGNLYYYDSELHMITLPDRVAIVKGLIDAAKKTDMQSVTTAYSAYDALTQKEKDRLGNDYYNKLLALEDDSWYTEPTEEPNQPTVTEPTQPKPTEPTVTEPTQPSAVDEVIMAINAIGKVTASSGPVIQNARSSYDSLTVAQKKQVTNYQALVNAEKAYAALAPQNPTTPTEPNPTEPTNPTVPDEPTKPTEPQVDSDVIFVQAYIDAIGEVTDTSGPVIRAARQYYNELTSAQKKKVTNLQVLVAAEKAFAKLEAQNPPPATDPDEGEDEMVQDVIGAINAIGKVTASSGSIIQNARSSYDSLTSAQKKQVTNYQILVAAEKAYAAIVAQLPPPDEGTTPTDPDTPADPTVPEETYPDEDTVPDTQPGGDVFDQLPEQEAMEAINAIGEVTAASGPMIEDARYLYDQLTAAEKAKVTNYQVLVDAEKAYAALTAPTTPTEPDITDPTVDTTVPDTTDPTVDATVPDETVPTVPTVPEGETDTAVIVVQVQINAIGQVSLGSGPVIQAARESYDALTPAQQAKVNNAQALFDAEAAYAQLSAGGNDDTTPAEEGDSGLLIYILVGAGVFVAALAAILIIAKSAKKKVPVEADENVAPQIEETPVETTEE